LELTETNKTENLIEKNETNEILENKSETSNKEQNIEKSSNNQKDNTNDSSETQSKDKNLDKNKEREFKINSGNLAIISSSLSLVLSAVNKLLRMLVLISGGLIIFLYIISALLSFFALFNCIKFAMKEKQITVDSYLCGISILVLILI